MTVVTFNQVKVTLANSCHGLPAHTKKIKLVNVLQEVVQVFTPVPNDERLFMFGLCRFNMTVQISSLPAPTLTQQTQD